jgi:hypothetical protein
MEDIIDFRLYAKNSSSYLETHTISFKHDNDFEEKYLLLNHRVNNLIKKKHYQL